MATVINNPPGGTGNDTGGGVGMVLGIILIIVVLILFFVFGWPVLNRTGGGGNTPRSGDSPGNNGTIYNVPDEIDVNVQQ